jgi:hypothetical protein
MPTGTDNLHKIEHIVVLMMENRSFDHMLGFLHIDEGREDIDGVRPGFANEANGKRFEVHKATSTKLVKAQDPCHSGWCVDEQVANDMSGFASNYAKTRKQHFRGDTPGTVMAYHTSAQLPVNNYLAQQFVSATAGSAPSPGRQCRTAATQSPPEHKEAATTSSRRARRPRPSAQALPRSRAKPALGEDATGDHLRRTRRLLQPR